MSEELNATLGDGQDPVQDAPEEIIDTNTEPEETVPSTETDVNEPANSDEPELSEDEILDLVASDPDRFINLVNPKTAVGRYAELSREKNEAKQQLQQLLQNPAVAEALKTTGQTSPANPSIQPTVYPQSPIVDILPDLTPDQIDFMSETDVAVYKATQQQQQFLAYEAKRRQDQEADRLLSEHNNTVKAIQVEDKLPFTEKDSIDLQEKSAVIYAGYMQLGKPISISEATRMAYAVLKPELQSRLDKAKSIAERARDITSRQNKQVIAGSRVAQTGGTKSEPADLSNLSTDELMELAMKEAGY